MKFGSVPLEMAQDGILAHSLSLPTGRMRKGIKLGPQHIAELRAAGYREVVVAQLEADDIDENAAAVRFADALVIRSARDNVICADAFTGRVNVIARRPGLVRLDADRLIASNMIDPAISVATVPQYQQMVPRGLIATIKIISYGVSGDALERACEAGKAAIDFALPKLRSASLFITTIPGGSNEVASDQKARAVTETRLNALGVSLLETQHLPHDPRALAEAIADARGELILILTGSATSDRDDVAPAGLRLAGGSLERFGIPVDPGNLLFLGALNERRVIGLPGCARSPALNGADWVLSRVICGVPISDHDYAAFGVGGLLKEIPTRPQPRRGK